MTAQIFRHTILQILFWCGFWVLMPLLLSGSGPSNWELYLKRSVIVSAGIAAVVGINKAWLLPKLYFERRRTLWYVAAGLTLVTGMALLLNWDDAPWAEFFRRPPSESGGAPARHDGPGPSNMKKGMRYLSLVMPFFTAFIGSALFEMARFADKKEKEAADYKSEKLEAEIKFLKSQINPHFLFNALNNIYTLTLLKSDQAPEHLLKLSDMLRYMLYDCKAATVPLHKEISYLKHFIDLQLLKDSRGLNVKVNLDESRPELPIAPMLLIPLVENAFKHAKIEDLINGWIDIRLETDSTSIHLWVNNSLPAEHHAKDKAGGIGLHNLRRQLELLYPDRHTLLIEEREGAFSAYLTLQYHAEN